VGGAIAEAKEVRARKEGAVTDSGSSRLLWFLREGTRQFKERKEECQNPLRRGRGKTKTLPP